MDANPWGDETVDEGPRVSPDSPAIARRSDASAAAVADTDEGWSAAALPSWTPTAIHAEPVSPPFASDQAVWPVSIDTDDVPGLDGSTPAVSGDAVHAIASGVHLTTPPTPTAAAEELTTEQAAEEDFGDFGETHLDVAPARSTKGWTDEEGAGWGGSSTWPPSDIHGGADVASSPKGDRDWDMPRWGPDTPQLEAADSAVSDHHPRPEEVVEDAWAAQARTTAAAASARPSLPPKIPAELLSTLQDRCHELLSSAFDVKTSSTFLPASGMGLAISSLLDTDGELAHLSSLASDELPTAAPLFAGSTIEKHFRSAVEATAARSAEILKGTAARRGQRLNWNTAGGDIWASTASGGDTADEPARNPFSDASGLDIPTLPSERLTIDSLTGSRASPAPPPPERGGLLGLFGRRTNSGQQTNMPASLLVPKATSPVSVPKASSPAPSSSAPIGRSVSAASHASANEGVLSPPSPALSAGSNTSVERPIGPSSMSRFFGRFSGAVRPPAAAEATDVSETAVQHPPPRPLQESWFRRQRQQFAFPPQRQAQDTSTSYQDDVGFTYDQQASPLATSPSKARHGYTASQNLDDLFGVFDEPAPTKVSAAKGAVQRSSRDPFDPFGASPEAPRTATFNDDHAFSRFGAASSAPVAPLQSGVTDGEPDFGIFGRANGLGPQPAQYESVVSKAAPPPTVAPAMSHFAIAPPPSSTQPLNRSSGPSLLDMEEGGPPSAAVDGRTPDPFMLSVTRPVVSPPPVLPSIAPAATRPTDGGLSLADLSFFES